MGLFRAIFGFLFRKKKRIDEDIEHDIRYGKVYVKAKRDELKQQHRVEPEAQDVANRKRREEKLFIKAEHLVTNPQVRGMLDKIIHQEEQVRQDEIHIAQGDLNPRQEEQTTKKDMGEEKVIEHEVDEILNNIRHSQNIARDAGDVEKLTKLIQLEEKYLKKDFKEELKEFKQEEKEEVDDDVAKKELQREMHDEQDEQR